MATAVQSSSAAAANPVQPTEDLLQLKQMVQDALIKRGVLGKLKAELRANVFAVLQDRQQPAPSVLGQNPKLQRLKASREGRILLDMMAEFFEYFDMHQTLATFTAEATMPDRFDTSLRPIICREIQLPPADPDDPLLMSVLRNYEQLAKSAGATLRTSHPELRRSQDALSVHHPKFVPPPVGSISPTHNHARADIKFSVLDDTTPIKAKKASQESLVPAATESIPVRHEESQDHLRNHVGDDLKAVSSNSLDGKSSSKSIELESNETNAAIDAPDNGSSIESIEDVKPIFSIHLKENNLFQKDRHPASKLPPLGVLPAVILPPLTEQAPVVREELTIKPSDIVTGHLDTQAQLDEEGVDVGDDGVNGTDDRLLATTSPPPAWDIHDDVHTVDESLDDLGSVSDVMNEFDYTESVERA